MGEARQRPTRARRVGSLPDLTESIAACEAAETLGVHKPADPGLFVWFSMPRHALAPDLAVSDRTSSAPLSALDALSRNKLRSNGLGFR